MRSRGSHFREELIMIILCLVMVRDEEEESCLLCSQFIYFSFTIFNIFVMFSFLVLKKWLCGMEYTMFYSIRYENILDMIMLDDLR